MASLALSLLAASPAQAGHYAGPTYSGGSSTGGSTPGPAPTTNPDNSAQGGWGGGNGMAYGCSGGTSISGTASCGGPPITASFTWTHDGSGQNDQNDPAPTVELVEESCDTNWTSNQTAPVSGYTVSGALGNPLGGPVTGGMFKGDQAGVKYSVQGGATLKTSETVTCSVTGSGGSPGTSVFSATASVSYGFTLVSPITVNLTGATKDSSGNYNILVGQQCSPTLVGIPTNLLPYTTYSWTVSGTTFQDWEPATPAFPNASPPTPANPQASYLAGGSGPLNIATPHWYWNDPNNTTETITCTATVTPPSGQGNAFSVTAKQTVAVVLPTWTAAGTAGYMQVNTKAPRDPNYELWAGPILNSGQSNGMNWRASVYTPTTPAFGTGSLEIVQIITPNESWTLKTIPPKSQSSPDNNVAELDGSCPYEGALSTELAQPLLDGDTPGIHLTSSTPILASATDKSSFIDYLLYQPPGSDSKWIALAGFAWSINGSASIPGTGNWADYVKQNGSDAAIPDTISPSGTTSFTGVYGPDFFPSWTRVSQ